MILRALFLLLLAGTPLLASGQSTSASVEERLRRLEERQEQLEEQLKQKDARIVELERQLGTVPAPAPVEAPGARGPGSTTTATWYRRTTRCWIWRASTASSTPSA